MRSTRFALMSVLLLVSSVLLAAQGESRPFSVVLDGHASPVFQPDGCTIINDEQGTGHANHLGRITWQSHETVDVCSNPDGGVVVGQITLTAANGDVVSGTYETLANLDFAAGQVTALGEFQITGGTGRFANAAGEGIISATGSLAPPFGVLGAMRGSITY